MEWSRNQKQNQTLKIMETLDQDLGLSTSLTKISTVSQRERLDWSYKLISLKSIEQLIPSKYKSVITGVTWTILCDPGLLHKWKVNKSRSIPSFCFSKCDKHANKVGKPKSWSSAFKILNISFWVWFFVQSMSLFWWQVFSGLSLSLHQ